ncbi:prolipoprotein diacylglyceryl transferase [Haloferula helveola]|uniref:Phosphatidylglycerol--prolipoprotein diacylglyceryl transferase n=1 Tax=Haloferula helveola TaxID=490095 RepID=A0ABN6H074_9BACT|nr:prolipoprotein diacylglyceryl transferase [Haloferula helveola]
MLATYVHDLDPVIFSITDQIKLRWYGLSYLMAFIVAVVLLNHLSKRKLWVLPPGSAGDFIAAAAIFGVFIGGRLGYMLYYETLKHGWGWVTEDPLMIFRVWDGGMASHGGILGLVIFTWFYARRKKVSWTGLGDGLCVVAPLGLMFGRLANFINGELYGRTAQGVAWAMKFPNTLVDPKLPEEAEFEQAMKAAASADERLLPALNAWMDGSYPAGALFEQVKTVQRMNPEVSAALEPFLLPRHPSQLYQAALEGGLLFAILWTVRLRYPKLPHGVLTGLFFIFYAVFRIIGEQFREPDAKMIGPLTSGQFLSIFMIVGGLVFVAVAMKRGKVSEES